MSNLERTGTVLIGSSDEKIRETLPAFLESNFGKNVICVKDTSDFLLEILDKQVDLSIIDVDLAGMPTVKAIDVFKKSRPRVPVIVLSDDYSVETGSRIMEHGIFYYVYKPIDLDRLRDVVESALIKRAKEVSKERR